MILSPYVNRLTPSRMGTMYSSLVYNASTDGVAAAAFDSPEAFPSV